MPSQTETEQLYMGVALLNARLSKAKRKKVGSVIVTKDKVLLCGYNGTATGTDNTCEDGNNTTLPTVIHSELNSILKAAREGVSVKDATLFVTLSPCLMCASMLLQAGITEVVYLEDYRDKSGVDFLVKYGVKCRQIEIN